LKYTKATLILILSILIMGVTNVNVFGFFFGFGGTEKWKEEVQLNNGRIIVIERETLNERGGDEWAFNRSGTKPKERRLRFTPLDGTGKTIEWQSTRKSPGTWPEKPLILDFEAGEPVVFASVYISEGCEIYLKYVYRNHVWINEALPEKFEKRTTNLLIRDGRKMPEFVDLEAKRKANAEIGYRRSLKQVGPTRQVCG